MELNKLESLLKKYDEGNTTLAEEKQLQYYLSSEEIPAHLRSYKMIFAYAANEKNRTYPGKTQLAPKKGQFFFIGIAASILLAIGIFAWQNNSREEIPQHNVGTIEDPHEAYQKTKEALQMVAQVFNTGREDLEYLNEFNKTKNKFIKNQ
ncbi:MAG: hypothetical protein MUP24_07365 [Gillisia sp.]|nr:hypothetical protein [Gillisia sp.]